MLKISKQPYYFLVDMAKKLCKLLILFICNHENIA